MMPGFKIQMPVPMGPRAPAQTPQALDPATTSAVSFSRTTDRTSDRSSSFFNLFATHATSTFSSSSMSSSLNHNQRDTNLATFPTSATNYSDSSHSSPSSSSPYTSAPSSPPSSESHDLLLESVSSLLRSAMGGRESSKSKREEMLHSILSLVVEELRQVKRTNQDLQKQLRKVVDRQNRTELALQSSHASSASLTGPPTMNNQASNVEDRHLSSVALADILNRMPFLMDYPVSPSTFVVNDPRYSPNAP